ncbi:MAG: hypothetical protein R3C59_26685 [Planctomycetaceae bacterium]
MLTVEITLAGSTATVVGDAAADELLITVDTMTAGGPFLQHNRFTAGDAGFDSDLDWDNTVVGEQRLAALAGSTVTVSTLGGGDDTLRLVRGNDGVTGSGDINAFIDTDAFGAGDDVLIVDDSTRTAAGTYTYQTESLELTGPGLNLNLGAAHEGGFFLVTGTGDDTVNVLGTFGSTQDVNLDSAGGVDTVNISGRTGSSFSSGFDSNVNIANTVSTSIVNINATGDASAMYSVANGQITTSVAVGVINYVPADVSVINLSAGDDDDVLTVDFVGGDPVPSGGLFFHGGNQGIIGDSVVLTNGTAATIEHTFQNANDGSVSIDGSLITYTGLEPVVDNLNAADRIFTFTGGAETIDLSDDAIPGDGFSLIDSTLGESVAFLNPTGSLTINAGTGSDVINLVSIDTATTIPALIVNGDDDDDTINGNAIAAGTFTTVTLNGNAGNDNIFGTAGDDLINGGTDNDTIVGFRGADIQNGDAGDDLFIWNNGDGADDNIGGADVDTFTFNGADGADDVLNLLPGPGDGSLVGAEFNLQRTAPTAFAIEGLTIENVVINGLAGNDVVDGSTVPSGLLTNVTINGDAGNDSLTGTQGADIIFGGIGNDTIVGGRGGDTIDGGDDSDTIIWNNGDGSDVIEGGTGIDTVVVNGAGSRCFPSLPTAVGFSSIVTTWDCSA